MSIELWSLCGAVFLGLVHVSAASFTFKAEVGNAYTVGARDEERRPTGTAGRLDRALRNFNETFAAFAALALMVEVTGCSGPWSRYGALMYLAGRTIYLPLYAAGVPWVRTFSWNLATLGLVLVMVQVVAFGLR
ncbi:MAG: MAPEG family protein [Nannocystaceae bacterium]